MKQVKLLGELGKKFGKSFSFDVANPAEAIRALCVNFPEFKAHLISSESRGVAYKVLIGNEPQTKEGLHYPVGKQSISIVPIIQGAKGGGILQTFFGAVLVALSFVPFLAPISPYLLSAGIAMMIGGVVQMLTPIPNMSAQNLQNDSQDTKPSYVFNGAVNTTAQGYPVPVGYGRMIVGSAVISASISTKDI
jgi:predicted phage tail protein